MTLSELCQCNAETLEKLTQEELDAICMPYWNVTRPEMAAIANATVVKKLTPEEQDKIAKVKKAQQMMNIFAANPALLDKYAKGL
jgi:hypothetical protein